MSPPCRNFPAPLHEQTPLYSLPLPLVHLNSHWFLPQSFENTYFVHLFIHFTRAPRWPGTSTISRAVPSVPGTDMTLGGELSKSRHVESTAYLGPIRQEQRKGVEICRQSPISGRWKRHPSLFPKPQQGCTWPPTASSAQNQLTRDRLERVQRSRPGRIKWRERVIYRER